jgi:dienelactone hydrolase
MSCCTVNLFSVPNGPVKGIMKQIDGILVYVTMPENLQKSDRAMLFLPEVHGAELPHAQHLADKFSEELNCPVFAPDLYAGQPMPMVKPDGWDDEVEMEKFLEMHHPSTVDPILKKIVSWIHRKSDDHAGFGGVKHLGAIGYCFGGRYVIRLLAAGLVDVGVVNHPSFFTMNDISALPEARPLAIFTAETDEILPEEKRRMTEDILKKNGATWMCTTYSGVDHGFRYVRTFQLTD